jgi:hypothetical protein
MLPEGLKKSSFFLLLNKSRMLLSGLSTHGYKSLNEAASGISHRNDGVVVRIYPGTEVEKTSGVKNILSEIAK